MSALHITASLMLHPEKSGSLCEVSKLFWSFKDNLWAFSVLHCKLYLNSTFFVEIEKNVTFSLAVALIIAYQCPMYLPVPV